MSIFDEKGFNEPFPRPEEVTEEKRNEKIKEAMAELRKPFLDHPSSTPIKATDLLSKAIETIGSRAAERDLKEERSMDRAVQAFNAMTGNQLTEEQGWLFMVCLKGTRAQMGETKKEDDYLDGSAYFALAGESVLNKEEDDPTR